MVRDDRDRQQYQTRGDRMIAINFNHIRSLLATATLIVTPLIMAACEADQGPYPFGW